MVVENITISLTTSQNGSPASCAVGFKRVAVGSLLLGGEGQDEGERHFDSSAMEGKSRMRDQCPDSSNCSVGLRPTKWQI
jgi:hypothetical protein